MKLVHCRISPLAVVDAEAVQQRAARNAPVHRPAARVDAEQPPRLDVVARLLPYLADHGVDRVFTVFERAARQPPIAIVASVHRLVERPAIRANIEIPITDPDRRTSHWARASLANPRDPAARPWLDLLDDEIEPRILDSAEPFLVMWSSLWPDLPDARVRFDIQPAGEGCQLRWTLLTTGAVPSQGRLGHLQYRLDVLINDRLRRSYGQ